MTKREQIKAYRAEIAKLAALYPDQGGIFCRKVTPTITRLFSKIEALQPIKRKP